MRFVSASRTIDDVALLTFAELSGDFNPLHLDEQFARWKGFERRLVHGALLNGSTVLIEVDATDLLGQGSVPDAALAWALLGLARALAIEGARAKWSINVVARGAEGSRSLAGPIDERLTGQLIYTDEGHLGRVRS